MATPIYVCSRELAISNAKKASSCMEDAISVMSKVENAVSGWELYIDAAADGFVFANSESEVAACLSALRTKQTQLDKLISVMQTGTEKLEDADAEFKNELTDPGLWERLKKAVGRAVYSSTIGKVEPLIGGITWISTLFCNSEMSSKELDIQVDPVINKELPTDSTSLHLDIHMGGYSLCQGDYPEFEKPYDYNAGCCALAYAVGLSIVNGEPVDPTKYWYNGTTNYEKDTVTWASYDASEIISELRNGKPTMLHYLYGERGEHWVLIIGVRNGANPNNLNMSDFEVLDPAYGDIRLLTDSYKFNSAGVDGGWRIN